MKRSEFLKVMGLTAVGAAFAPSILANGKQTNNVSRIATDIKDLKANVNRPVTFLVLGAGNRGSVYAGYAKKYPDCFIERDKSKPITRDKVISFILFYNVFSKKSYI